MRLISQDGKIDVPYDKVILGICDQNNGQEYVIYAYHDSPRPLFIATYSNTDKALKVMEMLRNAYCGKVIFQNVTIGEDVLELMKEWKMQAIISKTDSGSRIEYITNNIFVFPKDSEEEVQDE